MPSRTANILRNTKVSLVSKVFSLLLNFVSRTLFVKYLGTSYLGINGLFVEILQILNFTELGIGSALTFAMYEPIANNNETKIRQLIKLYGITYGIVAIVVTGLGLLILPFLTNLVKGAEGIPVRELQMYFILQLANTVFSYFVADKYSYVIAAQNKYIVVICDTVGNFIVILGQIVAIILYQNYTTYLVIQTIITILSKGISALVLQKRFPVLQGNKEIIISAEIKRQLFVDTKSLMVHKFSSVAVHATDNIIISSFEGLGITLVGLISNYNMLMNSVLGFVTLVFSSMASSFGNLVAASSRENYRKAFEEVYYLSFLIYAGCSIAFFVLIPPFITLWLGAEFVIEQTSFALIVINCFLQGLTSAYNYARDASGNFQVDQKWAFLQAICNLVISIIAVRYVGLVGVYIGTVVSRVLYLLGKSYATYQLFFGKPVFTFYSVTAKYLMYTLLTGTVSYSISKVLFKNITILIFFMMCFTTALITILLLWFFTHRSQVYVRLKLRAMRNLGRKNK